MKDTKKKKKIIKKEQFVPPKEVFDELPPEEEKLTPQGREALLAREYVDVLVEILKKNRTPIMKIVGKDEYTTLVNAVTLESEAELIQRVVVYLDNIRSGKGN